MPLVFIHVTDEPGVGPHQVAIGLWLEHDHFDFHDFLTVPGLLAREDLAFAHTDQR